MPETRLTLSVIAEEFAVCRLESSNEIPTWATAGAFFSVTRTPEELSIVCPSASLPGDISAEKGWKCLKVHGPLDFAQTGVLLALAEPLAESGISIFAVSTYDTDYLLVKEGELQKAVAALQLAGHRVNDED